MLVPLSVAIKVGLLVVACLMIWRVQADGRVSAELRWTAVLVGLTVGGLLCLVRYPPSADVTLLGWPFAFAGIEGNGRGLVLSPLPAVVALMNIGLITGFVHAIVAVLARSRASRTPTAAGL